MTVKNFAVGDVTIPYRTSSISVSGLDFTPTNIVLLPKPGYEVKSYTSSAGYTYSTLSRFHTGYGWRYYDGNGYSPEADGLITNSIKTTFSSGSATITESSYGVAGGTYIYIVWREE